MYGLPRGIKDTAYIFILSASEEDRGRGLEVELKLCALFLPLSPGFLNCLIRA